MTRAKLAIDLRYADGPLSGFGRFTWMLLEGLRKIGPPAPILLIRKPNQELPAGMKAAKGFEWLDIDRSPYMPIAQIRLARELAKEGVEVLFSPDCFSPLCGGLKQIITLHDIIPLRCPHLLPRSAKGRFFRLWRQWLRLQIGNADRVITVSDHARTDIADVFANAGPKLKTVYNAVQPGDALVAERPSLPPLRLLYVGRDAPYKNIIGCIKTTATLKDAGLDVSLTIAGEPDPRYPEVGDAIRHLCLEDRISVTGHVDEQQLLQLYREASVFLFLSRYEGFGLPPLEAMAHGLPVVSSDRASLPEVLGDAAILVDPDNVAAAANAVRQIAESPTLARDLVERGVKRAADFTVERQATMFWEVVEPIL